jgi:type I restriction enzyme S subunit
MRDLPIGWTWATVGAVSDVNPRYFDDMPSDDELVSKVPMAAVETESGRLDPSELVVYSSVKGKSLTPFQENDVLFAKVTPCMENGKVALARGLYGGRAVGSTELFVLRSRGAVEPNYLMYFLLRGSVRKEAERAMTGAVGLRRVPRAFLSSIPIPLAPLAEQRRIVAAIEAHLDRLVSGCLGLKQAYSYSRTYRHTVEDRAVLGRLIAQSSNPSDVERDLTDISERRSLRASRRRCHPQSSSPFHYEIPSHWAVVSMDQLCWDIEYGTSVKTRDEAGPGNVPVLRMGNIQESRIVMDSLKFLPRGNPGIASLMLEDGDLLFNRTNSAELVGKSAVYKEALGPATFASYLIRCRFADGANPDWANLVINSSIGRSYIASVVSQQVGQANVNGTKLARMPIPFPALSEQDEILAAVAEHALLIKRLKESIQIGLDHTKLLRESILSAAFTGRLVPQDPEDAAASVLPEQIRVATAVAKWEGL